MYKSLCKLIGFEYSNKIHHVAVICSDYEQSKLFYTEVLGLKIVS